MNGLDPQGVRWIRELLRAPAAQGRTVLVSSHLMSEMQLTADRLIVINRGRLLADSTVDGLVGESRSLEDAYLRLIDGTAQHRTEGAA